MFDFSKLCTMKYLYITLFILLVAIGFAAQSHDFFLLPESFYLSKGEKMDIHLFVGDKFTKTEERKFQVVKTTRFMLYEGAKKTDLIAATKDSAAPVISYAPTASGIALVEMVRNDAAVEWDRAAFTDYLKDEGLSKMEEKVNASNDESFREKYTRYMKTMIAVDGNGGNVFNKLLGEDYEIILKQNPYKGTYGDDITAVLYFRGKPVKAENIDLYVKTESGAMFPERLMTDNSGQVYFKLSREGIYMLRSLHMEATKSKDADYLTFATSFTFAFSNAGALPNSYKQFGFGDKH